MNDGKTGIVELWWLKNNVDVEFVLDLNNYCMGKYFTARNDRERRYQKSVKGGGRHR